MAGEVAAGPNPGIVVIGGTAYMRHAIHNDKVGTIYLQLLFVPLRPSPLLRVPFLAAPHCLWNTPPAPCYPVHRFNVLQHLFEPRETYCCLSQDT